MKGNKNYFILGLGVGILVVNMIYFVNPKKEFVDLTDEEIVSRAEDLGMVNLKDELLKNKEEERLKEEAEKLEDKEELEEVKTVKEPEEDLKEDPEEDKAEKLEQKKDNTEDLVEIVIEKGANLSEIIESLYDGKIIEDKSEFKEYIYEKDLSKKIVYGTYEIKKNSSYDEIVDIIVR